MKYICIKIKAILVAGVRASKTLWHFVSLSSSKYCPNSNPEYIMLPMPKAERQIIKCNKNYFKKKKSAVYCIILILHNQGSRSRDRYEISQFIHSKIIIFSLLSRRSSRLNFIKNKNSILKIKMKRTN